MVQWDILRPFCHREFAYDKRDLVLVQSGAQVRQAAAPEVVQHHHFIAPLNQNVHQMAPQEARTACYQDPHVDTASRCASADALRWGQTLFKTSSTC